MNEAFTVWEILAVVAVVLPLGFVDRFIAYRKRRKLEMEAMYWAEVKSSRHV